ncbi:MAG: hypothetical protein ACJA1A_003808 [Saprospiraceae bacterium]|jgi:hypothetical protein
MKKLLIVFSIFTLLFCELSGQKKSPIETDQSKITFLTIESPKTTQKNNAREEIHNKQYTIPKNEYYRLSHAKEALDPNAIYEVEVTTTSGDGDLYIKAESGNILTNIRKSENEGLAPDNSFYQKSDLESHHEKIIIEVFGFDHSVCRVKIFKVTQDDMCNNGFSFKDVCDKEFMAGDDVYVVGVADHHQDIEYMELFVNGNIVGKEVSEPYEWGRPNTGGDDELRNMAPGTYTLRLRIKTKCGEFFDKHCTITIREHCEIRLMVSDIKCDNNGTANDDSDDTYTFSVTAQNVQNGGAQWEGSYVNAVWGAFVIPPTNYGTKVQLGPFPAGTFTSTNTTPPIVVQGGLSMDVQVNAVHDFDCSDSETVHAPDNCTPTNCHSDFVIDINGNRPGSHNCEIRITQGQDITITAIVDNPDDVQDATLVVDDLALFDDEKPFKWEEVLKNYNPGTYHFTITISDKCGEIKQNSCTIIIEAPHCEIRLKVSDIKCDNNGTANDDSDDTYTFSVTAENIKNGGAQWEGSYVNAVWGAFVIPPTNYGTKVQLGPFPAGTFTSANTTPPIVVQGGLSIDVQVNAVHDFDCSDSETVHAPTTCQSTNCDTDIWFLCNGGRTSSTNCKMVYPAGHNLSIKTDVEDKDNIMNVTLIFRDQAFFDNTFPFEWLEIEKNMSPGIYPISMILMDQCGNTFKRECTIEIEPKICDVDFWFSYKDARTSTDDCVMSYSEGHNLSVKAGVKNGEDIEAIELIFRDQVFFDDAFPFEWDEIEKNMSPGSYPIKMFVTDICGNTFTRECIILIRGCELVFFEGHDLSIRAGVTQEEDIKSITLTFRDQVLFDTEFPFEWIDIEKNMSIGSYPIVMELMDNCGETTTKECTIVIKEKNCETKVWFEYNGDQTPLTNCEMTYPAGHDLRVKAGVEDSDNIKEIMLIFRDQAFIDNTFPFEWVDIEKNMSEGSYPISMILTDKCGNTFRRECTITIESKMCKPDFWFDVTGSNPENNPAFSDENDQLKNNESEKKSTTRTNLFNDASKGIDSINGVESEIGALQLKQNVPNPFDENTAVSFFNPIDSEVVLNVFDTSGKQLINQKAFYAKGWHKMEIKTMTLEGSGVYIYEVNNGLEVARKKMMSVN